MKSIKTASSRDKAIVTSILASILLSFSLVTQIPMEQADAQSTKRERTSEDIDWADVNRAYDKAYDFFKLESYEEASQMYQQALDIITGGEESVSVSLSTEEIEFLSNILNEKGAAHAYLGEYDDALKDFESAAEMGNDDARDNIKKVKSELNQADDGPSRTAR